MKPLHLIAGKDPLRPVFSYIYVREGFAYVSNGSALIKILTEEVFGDIVFEENEELLFDAAMWSLLKFHTAKLIVREGLVFKNLTSGTEILAKTPKEASLQIPNFDSVLPEITKPVVPVTWASFDPSILLNLAKALGTKDFNKFKFEFYGYESCIEVLHKDFPTMQAILMPTLNNAPVKDYQPIAAENKIVEAPIKTKKSAKKVTVQRDDVIDNILELLDKHASTTKAILDDYMLGDEDCRMELSVADTNLREEIADIEVEDTYVRLLEKVKDHEDFSSDDILELIVKEEGEISIHEYLQTRGYAIIKVDNMQDQEKLRDFVEKDLYPMYSDRDKYSI